MFVCLFPLRPVPFLSDVYPCVLDILFHYYFPCKSNSPLIHIADCWNSGVQNSFDLAHHWNNVVHNLLDLAHPWSRFDEHICSIDLAHHWSKFDEHMFNWSCTSLKQIWWAYVHLILHIIDLVMKGCIPTHLHTICGKNNIFMK